MQTEKHNKHIYSCMSVSSILRGPSLLYGSRTVVPFLQPCQMVVIQFEISRATSDTHCTLTWQPSQRSVSYICQPLSQGLKQLFCLTDVGGRGAESQTYETQMKWMHVFNVSGSVCVCVSMTDERLSVEREIVWAADGVCAWWFADCVHIYISSEWSNKKKTGLANTFGIPLEWAREFRLPITDCCLPSAWPQRPLLSPDPQTEPGCAAGMDCSGMHNSADKGRTFQKESWVFHPLVCFNCIALHLLPQMMREKTEKLGEIEEMSRRCFWDGPDKCQHNRASHFSACLLTVSHKGRDGAWLIILEFSF